MVFSRGFNAIAAHRWARLALLVAVLMGAIAPASTTAAMGTIVATSSVNIRACAALDCQVIGAAQLGDSIEVTGSLINGFYPVRWFGQEGFVFRYYLNPGGAAPWFVEGDPSCKRVALSFNIGIGYTPSQTILDTLAQQAVKATMFPMGWWAPTHATYLRQLDDAGFVIGTHGDQARFLTDATEATIRQDITASIAAIETVIGRPLDPYHTPYAADTDTRVRAVVSSMGLLPVGWKIAATDYGADATEAGVYSRVMNNMYPGAVVEFHLDGPATDVSTARALPRIIRDLRAQGYQLVTVPELVIPCTTSLPTYPVSGTVTNTGGDGLRCRTAPSTAAAIITTVPEGTRLQTRGAATGGWVPVVCAGQNGWVSSTYFTFSSPPSPTPTPSPTPAPTTSFGVVYNTNGANLRCRSLPSTSGDVITLLAPGARVAIRGAAINGWTPVRCASRDGWVSSTFLRLESTSPTPTPTPDGATFGTVSNTGGEALRCRTGPGTTYAVIMSLAAGTRVEVRGATTSGWVPVLCAGRSGWVSATYLVIS